MPIPPRANSAQEVLALLKRLNGEFGETVIMVTHDPHSAKFAKGIRYIEKGELLPEGKAPEDWSPVTPIAGTAS